MAFPILGQPFPTYTDDNGDPYSSGTLTFLEPTDDSDKYSYPTAVDADAASNANASVITLNQEGRVPVGIWGVDGQEYKVILKDSSGTEVWSDTHIAWDISIVDSTAIQYARTQAEEDANIAAYASGNTIGDIVNPYLEPGNTQRYGADPTGSTECHLALQNAINQQSHGGSPVYAPEGTYSHNTTVYFHWDTTNNTGFLNQSRHDGRIILRGAGGSRDAELRNRDAVGTVFKYTAASGYAFDIGDLAHQTAQGLVFEDFSIWSATSDYAMIVDNLSKTSWKRLGILNDAAVVGGGVKILSVFFLTMEHVDITGSVPRNTGGSTSDHGIGFDYEPVSAGGGANNCFGCNVNGFEYGWKFGGVYDVDREHYSSTWFLSGCEGNWNRVNWWFRHGILAAHLLNCWAENADGGGAADHTDFKFSDSCGYDSNFTAADNENPVFARTSGIVLDNCIISSGDGTATYDVEIGQATGTLGEDRVGEIRLKNCVMRSSSEGKIRRFNTSGNGKLTLEDMDFTFNSANLGIVTIDADEPQFGPIEVIGMDGWRSHNESEWCEEDAGNTTMYGKHFVGDSAFTVREQSTTDVTLDYSDVRKLPSIIRVAPANNQTATVKLPVNQNIQGTMETLIVRETSTTGIVKIDVDAVATWAATTEYEAFTKVKNSGTKIYVAQNDGTSASTEPTHSSGSTLDGTIYWRNVGNSTETINEAATVSFSPATVDSGTTDGVTTAFKLIQSGQNFSTTVDIGDLVYNSTDSTSAFVTNVDSDTQLTLDTDIMETGEGYVIYEPSLSMIKVVGGYSTAALGMVWTAIATTV